MLNFSIQDCYLNFIFIENYFIKWKFNLNNFATPSLINYFFIRLILKDLLNLKFFQL